MHGIISLTIVVLQRNAAVVCQVTIFTESNFDSSHSIRSKIVVLDRNLNN